MVPTLANKYVIQIMQFPPDPLGPYVTYSLSGVGSGVIAKRGALLPHRVSPGELDLCRRLAAECCKTVEGVEVGMGSESSDYFQPFYIAAIEGTPVPEEIDPDLVRTRFNGVSSQAI